MNTEEEKITQDVEKVVSILCKEPGVSKIWWFGRLARGEQPDFRSDLDFAVEGLAGNSYYGMWTKLDMATKYQIDLVRWEDANETLRDEIQKWGKIIYEAKE